MKSRRKLWRRKSDGVEFGSYHTYVRNKAINLQTDDPKLAEQRKKEAEKGQRKWPRVVSSENRGRYDRRAKQALDAVAALGAPPAPPASSPPPVLALPPIPPPAPDPPPPAPEVIEPERIPPPNPANVGDWASDVNSSAGATGTPGGAPDPSGAAEPMRFADLPWFAGALVTASKLAVGAQVKLQATLMRWIGDVEAGRVGPPPVKEPDDAESFAAFSKKLATPWEPDDPREVGRQIYEGFFRRVCPDELPIPDYLLAPIVVAICTLPVQLAGAEKRKADATQQEEVPRTEAAPHAQAAA